MTTTRATTNLMRAAARERRVADLAEGRKQRAVRFTDRRKEASRRACRDYR